jgi:hypothetical protein
MKIFRALCRFFGESEESRRIREVAEYFNQINEKEATREDRT